MSIKILILNPGSTSSKIAVYEDTAQKWESSIIHDESELGRYSSVYEQFEMRKSCVLQELEARGESTADINVIMSRGGLLPPVRSGAYEVNQEMVDALRWHARIEHPSNLGAGIALSLAHDWGIKAYIYDPVTVDEMTDIARITGLPGIERMSVGHILNMRAQAIRYAESVGKSYAELNIIVAHLGGGITLSLHERGRISDMISDEEGPFSPERAGGLPNLQLIDLIIDNGCTKKDAMRLLRRNSGLKAHCGTTDAREIEKRISEGDKKAELVYSAMAYETAKNIAKLAVPVCGKVDAIILTGGIARSEMLTDQIKKYISFIAPVTIFEGEHEMEALARGAYRVYTGQEEAKIFTGRVKDE